MPLLCSFAERWLLPWSHGPDLRPLFSRPVYMYIYIAVLSGTVSWWAWPPTLFVFNVYSNHLLVVSCWCNELCIVITLYRPKISLPVVSSIICALLHTMDDSWYDSSLNECNMHAWHYSTLKWKLFASIYFFEITHADCMHKRNIVIA